LDVEMPLQRALRRVHASILVDVSLDAIPGHIGSGGAAGCAAAPQSGSARHEIGGSRSSSIPNCRQ
jgi:hypothetical protein